MKSSSYLGHSSDHVTDDGLEGGDRAALLERTEPHLDVEEESLSLSLGLLLDLHFDGHVTEVLGYLSLWSLHYYAASLHCYGYYSR